MPRRITLRAILLLLALVSMRLEAASLIAVRTPADFARLTDAGFEVDSIPGEEIAAVTLADAADSLAFLSLNIPFQVIHSDLQAFYSSRLPHGRDDMGGYRTLAEINAEMEALHENFPDIVGEPFSIGRSIEGRDLMVVKISDNPDEDEDEPEAFFNGLTHADEVISPEILFEVMHLLTDGYGEDDRMTRLVDERELFFLPCVNPDGLAYMEQVAPDGGGGWRKNRRINFDFTIGVNINRNFGYEWGHDDRGSSPNPSSANYRGTAAFSEPETQALREFTNNRCFRTSIYFHAAGNLIYYPFGYDTLAPEEPDSTIYVRLAERMAGDSGYHIRSTARNGRSNGCSTDWMYASNEHEKDYDFLVEVGTVFGDGHWPARERVPALVAANIEKVLVAAEYADEPARVLPPKPPENLSTAFDWRWGVAISWDEPEDAINPPVLFAIAGRENIAEWRIIDEIANDTVWRRDYPELSGLSFIRIMAIDGEGDSSVWSDSVSLTLPDQLDSLDLTFRRGWSIVSLNVSPEPSLWVNNDGPDVEQLFLALLGQGARLPIQLVKDSHGRFWAPGRLNQLPFWNLTEGYWVRSDSAFSMQAPGLPIPADTPVPVEEGWNIVAYFPDQDLSAQDAFSNIGDNLIIAKNEIGQFYIPARGFSNMNDLTCGAGYQIKVRQSEELVWAVPQGRTAQAPPPDAGTLKHFAVIRTDCNMSVLVASASSLQGELAAFTKGGRCVGAVSVSSTTPCGLAVWGDDASTSEIDGAIENEALTFCVWNGATEYSVDVDFNIGDDRYATDGFAQISIAGLTPQPTEWSLSEPYPNPFNMRAAISFDIPKAASVRLALYSLDGREAMLLSDKQYEVGTHEVTIDAEDLAAGTYLLQLKAGEVRLTRKLTLLK